MLLTPQANLHINVLINQLNDNENSMSQEFDCVVTYRVSCRYYNKQLRKIHKQLEQNNADNAKIGTML